MPAQRKYPRELRECAVRMVLEIQAREGWGRGEVMARTKKRAKAPARTKPRG